MKTYLAVFHLPTNYSDHRSKHVGAFKCFKVRFKIIQDILLHLLVLIICVLPRILMRNFLPLE
jgi:hypothetical protein